MTKYISALLFLFSFGLYGQNTNGQQSSRSHIFSSILGPNSEPILYNTVSLNSYELLTTSISYSKENQAQKVVFTPLKLLSTPNPTFWKNTKINIAQKNSELTAGIGISIDTSDPFNKKNTLKYDKIIFNTLSPPDTTESYFEYNLREAEFILSENQKLTNYYEDLVENSFKITLGYNTTLFKVVGGDPVDLNNDMLIDNFHKIKSHHVSLGIAYIIDLGTALNITLHYSNRLSSAIENQKRINYSGASFSFVRRISLFDKNYKRTPSYVSSLFIPGLYAGISIEFEEAHSNLEFLLDGINKKIIYTPYLEFKINPTNQFRLGIPIQKFTITSLTNETSIGPLIQWTLQLSGM